MAPHSCHAQSPVSHRYKPIYRAFVNKNFTVHCPLLFTYLLTYTFSLSCTKEIMLSLYIPANETGDAMTYFY